MRKTRPLAAGLSIGNRYEPQLMVLEYVATRRGDLERGPMARVNSHEARIRLLENGELARVKGPRRKELAVLVIDDAIPDGRIALRDVAGIAVTEHVTLVKPDLDTPAGGRHYA